MMIKYILLSLAASVLVTASDPYFGVELSSRTSGASLNEVKELSWFSPEYVRPYLEDHGQRVKEEFTITPYYYPMVQFWFLMYTTFSSSQVAIHDKNNLSLIYKVLDFSSLREKGLSKNTLYILQQKLSQEKLDDVRDDLKFLVEHPYSLHPSAKRIYKAIFRAGIDLPGRKAERVALFKELINGVRTQTGQRDFIRAGLVRSMPYRPFLKAHFSSRNLPEELLAIPFLESSFNPLAESKVSAMGAWQFMPLIGSFFMPKRTAHMDYRSNVGVASVSAASLMAENYMIMKSWDLAVTAYNSGTKHLLEYKRKLASSQVGLEEIIKNSDSDHFGFASKNFYSEFLALAHTLAYQEELFSDLHDSDRPDGGLPLRFYLAKCSMRLDKVLAPDLQEEISYYNDHLRALDRIQPRGLIITTKSGLPKNRFLEVSERYLLKKKPKDWIALLSRQSCSTI